VLQPASLKNTEAQTAVRGLAPDVCAVAVYGQWFPSEVFTLPPKRLLNLHPSLLPRHCGAAPVSSTILSGDEEVGLSVILIEEEMDAGDILAQRIMPIGKSDTTGSIMARLAKIGAPFFVDTQDIKDFARGQRRFISARLGSPAKHYLSEATGFTIGGSVVQ
jgi:methionyl-tRNA formyltransferase